MTGGIPDILSCIADVSCGALYTAWYHKYDTTMRIRPEVYAQRLELVRQCSIQKNENYKSLLSEELGLIKIYSGFPERMLELIKDYNGNESLYLKLQYAEGSPTHPSYPAGYAVVAGACVTILKAMLDCHHENYKRKEWPTKPIVAIDKDKIIEHDNEESITIVGELNKLASNISFGRNFAGVHYRSDGQFGIELGELYTISYLQKHIKSYRESYMGLFNGFILEKFDGTMIRINIEGIEYISSNIP